MKIGLKILVLLSFFVFSQMATKNEEFLGKYNFITAWGSTKYELKSFHRLKVKHFSCYSYDSKGKWKVEKENIIVKYKNGFKDKISDTLKINREKGIITSIGRYKKIKN